jgi:hypothetical protein
VQGTTETTALVFRLLYTHAHVPEENMPTSFAEFTKTFQGTSPMKSKPTAPPPDTKSGTGDKRRQLRGQIAGIIQELLNVQTLSDTDRRLLNISSAVALLLDGGR